MKKSILAVAMTLLGFTMNAQELMVDKTDEFTGSRTKLTNDYKIAKGTSTLYASVGHVNDSYAIYIKSNLDLGCAGARDNYIIFLFSDGTNLKIENDVNDIDCSDEARSIYLLDPSDFEGKTVSKIRLRQSKLYDDCITEAGVYTIQELINAVE